jgi:UV DNA damage repair endonuclease
VDGLEIDVMLEAKAKDLALLRLREQLAARPQRARAT